MHACLMRSLAVSGIALAICQGQALAKVGRIGHRADTDRGEPILRAQEGSDLRTRAHRSQRRQTSGGGHAGVGGAPSVRSGSRPARARAGRLRWMKPFPPMHRLAPRSSGLPTGPSAGIPSVVSSRWPGARGCPSWNTRASRLRPTGSSSRVGRNAKSSRPRLASGSPRSPTSDG